MKWIRYNLCTEVNYGTIEQIFSPVKMSWSETNEEIAKREAYNGEYTIEDDGEPEPDTATTDDVLNALLGVSV